MAIKLKEGKTNDKFKKTISLTVFTCLCIGSMNLNAFASSTPYYVVEESMNNGVTVQTIGNGDTFTREEKEAIKNELSANMPTVYSYDVISEKDTGLASNKDAHCETYVETEWDVDREIVLTSTGYTEATWFGAGDWDECVINQSTTINSYDLGLTLTVPLTVSVEIVPDGKTATWTSNTIDEGWNARADRSEIVAESAVWISSFIAEDSADIYVDNNIYRPSTYIKIDKP